MRGYYQAPSPFGINVDFTLTQFMICQDCESVHRRVSLGRDEVAYCAWCDAVLAQNSSLRPGSLAALSITAAILFVIANVTPLLGVEFGGTSTHANVWLAVAAMQGGWLYLPATVLAAVMLFVPFFQIALLLWVLCVPNERAGLGRRAALLALHRLRPWGMTEVFLLGSVVAIVKLSNWVHVSLGPGIWALCGLTAALTLLSVRQPASWWDFAEKVEG